MAVVVTGVLHALAYWYVTSDDAFISLRYARNLAGGAGLVYNPGLAPVEGFSNPLFTLLGASLIRLGIAPLLAVKLLGLCSMAAVVVATGALARVLSAGEGRAAATAAGMLAAGSSYVALWSAAGLETAFYAALVTTATLAVVREIASGHARHGPILFVGVAATRPEGVLLAAVAAGVQWLLARFSVAVLVGWTLRFALPCVVLLAARFAYFGALVPNTAQAKVFVGAEAARFAAGYLASFFAQGGYWIVLPALLLLWPGVRRDARGLVPLAVVVAQCVFVVVVGADYMPGYRFLVPVYPLVCVLAALGVQGLATRFGGARGPVLAALAVGVLALGSLITQAAALGESPRRFWLLHERPRLSYVGTTDLAGTWLEAHAAAGEYLAAHAAAGDVVVVTEAGVIPFYSELTAVDLLGLNDRTIADLWRREAEEQRLARAEGRAQARYWGLDIAAHALADAPRWVVLDGHVDAQTGRLVPRLAIAELVMRSREFQHYRRVFSAKVYDGARLGLGPDRVDVVFERGG